MKQILFVAAGVLLAGLVGWAAVDFDSFRHPFAGYSDKEIKQAEQDTDLAQAKVMELLKHDTLEAEIGLAETRYGEGSLYRLCHEYGPTTKQNKAKCKRLDEKMSRSDAEDAKHLW